MLSASMPVTITAAGFQASRLDTLRTRTSAVYRGLYILLQQEGAKDFFWKARISDIDRNEKGIDIHHIFPRKWCNDHGISPRIFNAIVNKTAISAKANRKIGGNAPSIYLKQLQGDPAVQVNDAAMDDILVTHKIETQLLRADDFEQFFQARKRALLIMVEKAMGKQAVVSQEPPPEDGVDDEDEYGEEDAESEAVASGTVPKERETSKPRRQPISIADFFASCAADTHGILQGVIDGARAAGYTVKWTPKGFSLRCYREV